MTGRRHRDRSHKRLRHRKPVASYWSSLSKTTMEADLARWWWMAIRTGRRVLRRHAIERHRRTASQVVSWSSWRWKRSERACGAGNPGICRLSHPSRQPNSSGSALSICWRPDRPASWHLPRSSDARWLVIRPGRASRARRLRAALRPSSRRRDAMGRRFGRSGVRVSRAVSSTGTLRRSARCQQGDA